jgi:hypothetical protein
VVNCLRTNCTVLRSAVLKDRKLSISKNVSYRQFWIPNSKLVILRVCGCVSKFTVKLAKYINAFNAFKLTVYPVFRYRPTSKRS